MLLRLQSRMCTMLNQYWRVPYSLQPTSVCAYNEWDPLEVDSCTFWSARKFRASDILRGCSRPACYYWFLTPRSHDFIRLSFVDLHVANNDQQWRFYSELVARTCMLILCFVNVLCGGWVMIRGFGRNVRQCQHFHKVTGHVTEIQARAKESHLGNCQFTKNSVLTKSHS